MSANVMITKLFVVGVELDRDALLRYLKKCATNEKHKQAYRRSRDAEDAGETLVEEEEEEDDEDDLGTVDRSLLDELSEVVSKQWNDLAYAVRFVPLEDQEEVEDHRTVDTSGTRYFISIHDPAVDCVPLDASKHSPDSAVMGGIKKWVEKMMKADGGNKRQRQLCQPSIYALYEWELL